MFGFKKTDPICSMKQEKGKGIDKNNNWFCSTSCLNKYEKQMQHNTTKKNHKSCCH